MLLSPGSIIAGKFRLERPLAQGGMGSVWVALDQHLEVPVALKFMAPAFAGSADLTARFEREAKAAAQLRHPNVVQIFEHGVDRGLPFIAMELLEGESLGLRLRDRRRLTLAETSRVLGAVCLALRRAHEKGLVHRDLKPANIFLSRHDELEVVKVLDFGIAKSVVPAAQEDVTKSGAVFGSPHYMAPEQARRTNRQVDHRSDLWALGVISYRCLTGHLPFPGDDAIDVLVRVCTEPPPVPSSLAPDLGPAIDRFFARALAREPDARFQSARDFAEALAGLAELEGRENAPGSERSADSPDGQLRPFARAAAGDSSDRTATLPIERADLPRVSGTLERPTSGTIEPTFPGTLTSAGAELAPSASPTRGRSWVVPGAAAAALAVLGIVLSVVLLSRDPAQESADNRSDSVLASPPAPDTTPAPASPGEPTTGVPSASPEVTPSASAGEAAPAMATATSATSAAPSAVPGAAAEAPSKTTTVAKGSPGQSGPLRPGAATTAKTRAPSSPQPSSGYLGKPKF